MTKTHAIESARQSRAVKGGTWYVIHKKGSSPGKFAGYEFIVIESKLYRRKIHGIVVAIVASA